MCSWHRSSLSFLPLRARVCKIEETSGYSDSLQLALHRVEAWTVLDEPARAQTLLRKLAGRSDLGRRRGEVLLQLGEHELFDAATAGEGTARVRQALAAGLPAPDEWFAKGLLAESSTEALDCFRQTLRLDPYHHGAHVQSLAFEFLLGRDQEFATHARIFKVLYPDDPSPDVLEAARLALRGRLAEARRQLSELRRTERAPLWKEQDWALEKLAAASRYYTLDTFLNPPGATNAPPEVLTAEFSTRFSGGAANQPGLPFKLRLPFLPCIREGLLAGNDAVRSLTIPFVSDIPATVGRIKTSLRHHPEALVPLMAGIILEQHQPRQGAARLPLMETQAELFQLASECPSVMPGLAPLAQFLAAKTDFEVAVARQTNSAAMRLACLNQIRRATQSRDLTVAEDRVYFEYAFGLGDYVLADELLDRWQEQQPADEMLARKRIELAIASGQFVSALKRADAWLARHPGDEWAATQRRTAIERLAALIKTIENTNPAAKPTGKP